MKRFNVRELSRNTAQLLETCELDGGVIIQSQDGRRFELIPRSRAPRSNRSLPDFAARQRSVFGRKRYTSKQINALFDAIKGRQ
ncbi:MAG: hypothetical protein AB1705_19725 [Verrucomicrobiota bacterium]